jgi:hypothetical protein
MDAVLNWADSSRKMGKPNLETYTRQATVAVGNTLYMNGAHLRLRKPFYYNNGSFNRAFLEVRFQGNELEVGSFVKTWTS